MKSTAYLTFLDEGICNKYGENDSICASTNDRVVHRGLSYSKMSTAGGLARVVYRWTSHAARAGCTNNAKCSLRHAAVGIGMKGVRACCRERTGKMADPSALYVERTCPFFRGGMTGHRQASDRRELHMCLGRRIGAICVR